VHVKLNVMTPSYKVLKLVAHECGRVFTTRKNAFLLCFLERPVLAYIDKESKTNPVFFQYSAKTTSRFYKIIPDVPITIS